MNTRYSNSSEDTNNNSNLSMNLNKNSSLLLTPKMKCSYERIFNEFSKVENSVKEFIHTKKSAEDKRKNRIKMLELKLQGFSEEVKNVNFASLHRQLEDLNQSVNDDLCVDKSSKVLIRNDLYRQEIMNSELDQPENKDNVLINQILNLNATKGDEMKQFIESLLLKTGSEIQTDTIRNLKI